MPPRPRYTIDKRASLIRTVTVVGVVVAILVGLGLIAPRMADTEAYKQRVISAIQKATGKQATIHGRVSLSYLPLPALYVSDIELRDGEPEKSPALTADSITMYISPLSIFSKELSFGKMEVEAPMIELKRVAGYKMQWDWLSPSLLKSMLSVQGDPIAFVIHRGQVLYHNGAGKDMLFGNINTEGSTGTKSWLRGGMSIDGHAVRWDVRAEAGGSVNATLTGDDGSKVELTGTLDLSGDRPDINGKITADVENAMAWAMPKPENPADAPVAPNGGQVKLTADWVQKGLDVTLSNMSIEGFESTGTGKVTLAWEDWRPVISVSLDFTKFTYDPWKELVSHAFGFNKEAKPNSFSYQRDTSGSELPKDIRVALDVTAKDIHVGGQVWQAGHLQAELGDEAITVNQFTLVMPGDTQMALFGIVSRSATEDLRFEGSMESSGKSLSKLLTIFDESATNLPEALFGKFNVRSNIFISSEQLRLSEADTTINDLNLKGGLVAYFDATPRFEAEVKLHDINFDYFRDVWRDKQKANPRKDFFLKFDRTMKFDWLQRLRASIDFKIYVDRFRLLERDGSNASFRLFAKQNELGIYNMRFAYPQNTSEASFTLNVASGQPIVSLIVNTDVLDTNYFSTLDVDAAAEPVQLAPLKEEDTAPLEVPAAPSVPGKVIDTTPAASSPASIEPPPVDGAATGVAITPQSFRFISDAGAQESSSAPKAAEYSEDIKPNAALTPSHTWSKDLFDMSWMEGWGGGFDISVGRLTHGGKHLDRVKFQGKLENKLLTIQSFTFFYWGGRSAVSGAIYGGEVPGASVGYTLYNIEARDMLGELIDHNEIGGKLSISGTLSTSGVNPLSWVQQADAKMVFTGRGILVKGLNLQAVVDAVAVARTASDVFNNVNRSLNNGSTQFSVDGNVNLKGGVLRTPGMTLKAPGNILGNLTGDFRLVPWNMELSTLFQFPAMTSETIPTMTVQLIGPVAAPSLRTDTSSLEAYVAKRIVGK